MFDFPSSPTVGDMVSGGTNGAIYRWDGTKWALAGPPPSTVQSFNSRTGAVTLAGGDVSLAQGYMSYDAANPAHYVADAPNDANAYVRSANAWANGDARYMLQAAADARYLKLDGTVPMAGALTLPASPPTLAQHATNKAYVDAKPSGSFVATTTGSVSLTGTLSETALASLRIPANTIGANGVIEVKALWTITNNANTKTLLTRFGSAAGISGPLATTNLAVTTVGGAQTMAMIRCNNATNSQVAWLVTPSTPFGAAGAGITTLTTDTTADTFVNLNCVLTNVADTVTLVHAYLVVFPHA